MESPRLRLLPLLGAALLLLLPLLGAGAQEDSELQPRALDIYSAVEDASHEKELVGIALAPGPCFGTFSSPPPPRSRSQGTGSRARSPGTCCCASPGAPDSAERIPVPRSNRSRRGSGSRGQYRGQRSLTFHLSHISTVR